MTLEQDPLATPTEPRRNALTALSSRDFRLLWGGQTISMIGDAAFLVALGWRTFSLGGSSALGLVLMLQAIGMLTTVLLGGWLADRFSRRSLMIVSDLARAGLGCVLVALELAGATSVATLGAVALAGGLATGFFFPAFGGIVPLVVDGHQLASANALVGTSRQLSLVLGPALAGLLYDSLGPAALFGLDAATYVVAAVMAWLARPRASEREGEEGGFAGLSAGFRYVASDTWLWGSILLFTVFLMLVIAPVQVLLPELVADHFGRGVGSYGLVFAAQGVGMALGGLAYAHVAPRRHRGVVSYVLWTFNAAMIVVFVLSPWFGVALVLAMLRGAAVGIGIAIWQTVLMERVPEGLLSRVLAVDLFGSIGLMPVGLVAAGAASELAGPEVLLIAGASVCTLAFAACIPARWVRAVQ